jgi:phenylalanyl-tRNA synthetase beta chain
LVIVLTGPRSLPAWQASDIEPMDFYDLKGVVNAILQGLHLAEIRYEPLEHPTFHPGKCARVMVGGQQAGVMGELHPLVCQNYELTTAGLLAADFDLDSLLAAIPPRFDVAAVPAFPPVLEDLAVVVDESVTAERVEETIRQAGGATLAGVRLFDVYRGEQIGKGLKSLAYSLTYQASDRTLTDQESAQIRQRILRRLEQELNARLRS